MVEHKWCKVAKLSLQDTFPRRHGASVIVKNSEAYWIGGFGVDLYNDVYKFKQEK